MAEADLTAARLRELLHYDPLTGYFTRRVRTAQRHHVGDRADCLIRLGNNKGYYRVSIDSMRFLAHRVAWLYVHGVWPPALIDHRNGKRGDNWILNLRQADTRLNVENRHAPRTDNRSGYLGVMLHPQTGKWRARIQVNRKSIHLGLFDTPQEAHAAYLVGKRKHHAGCTI